MNKLYKSIGILILITILSAITVACGGTSAPTKEETNGSETKQEATEKVTGSVEIDGSSTVFPIQEAVAEEFRTVQPDVEVAVSVSGTGGGFKRFAQGATDISNASRPIKDEEAAAAKENGVEFVEIPVAFDGLSVVVSKDNDFVKDLTIAELNKIWTGEVTMWSEVRSEFPAEKINLYGPGTDSGTFDYWNEVVIEADEGDTITNNFSPSEDDNVIVQAVTGDKYALGYFGYAYYIENKAKLNVVGISSEEGAEAVLPTEETIENGVYSPLSRPLFVYVNKKSYIEKPQVRSYVDFLVNNAAILSPEVGYIRLPQAQYDEVTQALSQLK
jgi:phosphate transport system substrate-binding protein